MATKMTAQSKATGPTSLRRIQRLEVDFPTFDSQLEEVKQILQDAEEQRRGAASSFYGREQWALRWMLKRFGAVQSDECM